VSKWANEPYVSSPFVVYGYVADGGDGSYSIFWLDGKIEDHTDEDYIEGVSDGDGLSYRSKLTFDSKEAAIKAGIRYEPVLNWLQEHGIKTREV
jgi:hypothetical protein